MSDNPSNAGTHTCMIAAIWLCLKDAELYLLVHNIIGFVHNIIGSDHEKTTSR